MMTRNRRQFLHLAANAATLPLLPRLAQAQAYPSRPVTVIVPFPAGGPADTVARVIGEAMKASLGQPVIVENVAGAGGSIGIGRAARAPADGYTLALGIWGTHVVNPAIYALPYDAVKDFEPVALLTHTPHLILAKNAVPAGSLKELIAWLKANPGKATIGHAGAGSPPHVGGVLFQNAIGANLQFVPYRGGAPAMQDLIAGQIDLMIDPPGTAMPHIRAGRIKALALAATSRSVAAPDIPTADEAGLPGFHFSNWFALYAPGGTPKPLIDRLTEATQQTLADAKVRARLTELGLEQYPREQQTPQALAALQKTDTEKWWPIIKAANIKGE
jgi:tripartite-type tricarboxylate transporter receptor subunit TctC